ncbi:MAG: dephospho-CoA kinase [Acidobacteria bacterium]|nr:dephospho-CoA kinase [Acidobacteriota bacterium]
MLLVGLTGNIASGKSTVAKLLEERGATVIDADILARRAVDAGTPAYHAILDRWGNEVLSPDGELDRKALRHLVFGEADEISALNEIVHPEVARLREELVAEARERGDRMVICDIPLLFEKKLVDEFDLIVLVDAPRPVRMERLTHGRGIPETDAMNMIAAQMPAELKRARADIIIENADSRDALAERVDDVWAKLEAEAAQRDSAPQRTIF